MLILEKEEALKISSILASSYYQKWQDYLLRILRITRDKRNLNNHILLLAMQFKLAEVETKCWKLLKEGRLLKKDLTNKNSLTEREQSDLQGINDHILIHQQLIRMCRTICDGIAWRNLNYNRTFLSSVSRGFGAGSVDVSSQDFKSEFEWAYRISETMGSLVILNDLTRFLRIGDLTEIKEGIAFIHEIKKYGKDVKNLFTLKNLKPNAKISRQAKRLLEMQRIALTNEVLLDEKKVITKRIDVSLKSHIPKVKQLIRQSEKTTIAHGTFESGCISFEVTNFDTIKKNKVGLKKLKKLSFKDNNGDFVLVHSNWDSFYWDERQNFLRSIPPYSIYPFSAKDCIKLMSGSYLVKSHLNITKLKKVLIENNWEIEERNESDLDKELARFDSVSSKIFSKKYSLYKFTPNEGGLFIIKRGPFSITFDSLLYSRITMEYLTISSFLQILEAMYEQAAIKKSDDIFFPRFNNESSLWK